MKLSNTAWAQPTFQDGAYSATGNGFNFRNNSTAGGTQASVLPDAGRTYHFDVPVTNDAAVTHYNIERLPAGQGYAYSALVKNVGTAALSNVAAMLTVSGANSATRTAPIAALAVGATATVTFLAVMLAAAGTNNVSIAVASDGNNANNA